MRKVKFRGKGIEDYDKDRWYYGSYYKTDDTTYCCKEDYDKNPNNTKHYILFDEMTDWCLPNRKLRADININTLGQYTGLKDKNGKEVYEGDIIRNIYYQYSNDEVNKKGFKEEILQVVYRGCGFIFEKIKTNEIEMPKEYKEEFIEVIGNIYENPELLED